MGTKEGNGNIGRVNEMLSAVACLVECGHVIDFRRARSRKETSRKENEWTIAEI
jgi:hypothetical protein